METTESDLIKRLQEHGFDVDIAERAVSIGPNYVLTGQQEKQLDEIKKLKYKVIHLKKTYP